MLQGSTTLVLKTSLTLDDATIHVGDASGPAAITFSAATLSGTGGIVFDGSTPVSLTFGDNPAGVTIRTGAGSGTIVGGSYVNYGTISAQSSGQGITLAADGYSNRGVLEAKNGGMLTLTLSGGAFSNGGTISASNGGVILLSGYTTGIYPTLWGTLTASDSTIEIAYATMGASSIPFNGNSVMLLPSGALLGQTVTLDGPTTSLHLAGGMLYGGLGTVSLTTTNGASIIAEGSVASTLMNIALNGADISLNSTSVNLRSNTSMGVALSGSGALVFDGNGSSDTITLGSSPVIISGGIRTGTAGGTISFPGGTITLQAAANISSQTSGKDIAITAATLSNAGTLEAVNGGTMHVTATSSFSSTGTIRIGAGSTMFRSSGPLALNGGTLCGYGTFAGTVFGGSGAHTIAPARRWRETAPGR